MQKSKVVFPIIALLAVSSCALNDSSLFNSRDNSIESLEKSLSTVEQTYKAHMINTPNKEFNKNVVDDLDSSYITSLQNFAGDFYQNIQTLHSSDDNQVFSPISIATCYSMLLDGAKNKSKEELENLLHYSEAFNHLEEIQKMLLKNAINDKNGNYLDICQSFWVDNSYRKILKEDYIIKLTKYYYAEAFSGMLDSDFMHTALADYINDKTNNFLNVKPEDFQDYAGILWLLNTIYLKAQWREAFLNDYNVEDDFYIRNGQEKQQVTYMRTSFDTTYYQGKDYKVASLSLAHGLNFNILLPDEDVTYPGALVGNEVAIEKLLSYKSIVDKTKATVNFKIPQFKCQKHYDLKKALVNMGVTQIFDPINADLTDIADLRPDVNLYVSASQHEAGIEVSNEGIEAAAYTIIGVDEYASVSDPLPVIDFIVNRPFAYAITSYDEVPLFMGFVNHIES